MTTIRQSMVTLDLEGVLFPEIWVAVADATGIEGLARTTRDEPDYDALMQYRLGLLTEHGITMSQVAGVISSLSPLPGARSFLDALRQRTEVIILSDTFEEFATALAPSLGMPTILCHRLVVTDDQITGYQLRLQDPKRRAVEAFQGLNYRIAAAGDSYNDISMLTQAETGVLFRAPEWVVEQFPQFESVSAFDGLLRLLEAFVDDGIEPDQATP